jgi:hypothetical protein
MATRRLRARRSSFPTRKPDASRSISPPLRNRCSHRSRARAAIRILSLANGKVRRARTLKSPGPLSARPLGSTACGFTTCAIPSRASALVLQWACLSSANCSVTLRPRPRIVTRISTRTRCGALSRPSARRSRRRWTGEKPATSLPCQTTSCDSRTHADRRTGRQVGGASPNFRVSLHDASGCTRWTTTSKIQR